MPDSFEVDNAESSGHNEFEPFGQISVWQFRELMDEAAQHAVTVTADPVALPWRSIGPRNIGGRIRALAITANKVLVSFSASEADIFLDQTTAGCLLARLSVQNCIDDPREAGGSLA